MTNQKTYMVSDTSVYQKIRFEHIRNINPSDACILGVLLYDAFKGSVDDEGETKEQAIAEAENTLNGLYGQLIWDASFIVVENNIVIACSLVCMWEASKYPLLTFSATLPEFRKKGYATSLISKSFEALSKQEIGKLSLFVSKNNHPALSLYRKIGFKEEDFRK